MKIIDVSKYNGAIDWKKAAYCCDGVIIRAGYRGYGSGRLVVDPRYQENIEGAKKYGLPVGVYFVTQAITETEAVIEARYTIDLIKGSKSHIHLPVFIDSEDGNGGAGRADRKKLTIFKRTEILNAFCYEIRSAGYIPGIYASESWFQDRLDIDNLAKCFIWVAKYSKRKPSIPYHAWQYTDSGIINGIKGKVDISEFEAVKVVKKTDNELADEVIRGLWGTGDERIRRLTAAGYDYAAIQKIVNEKIMNPSTVYYTVVAGDSLTKIAKKYKTTVKKLKELNNIKDPDKIKVGQNLKVKGG